MKPAHIFRDQVNTVAQWFDQWNDIEQTIACYSLLKRLGPTQARFLSLVLEYTFRDHAYEVQILEDEANGKGKSTLSFIMLKITKQILWCSHRRIFKAYFAVFQHYERNTQIRYTFRKLFVF